VHDGVFPLFFLAERPKICFVISTTFCSANPQRISGGGEAGLAFLNRLDYKSRRMNKGPCHDCPDYSG
jgi:hypothetical protein